MNIAIAGNGLVGRLLAIDLLKHGHKITLFDKDSKDGKKSAAYTAAGMLAPFAELETAQSIIYDYGLISQKLWIDILDDIDLKDAVQNIGSIITAHPQDMSELEHFITSLKNKVSKAKDIKMINNAELTQLEPELQDHNKAYFLKDEGVVDSQWFIEYTSTYLEEQKNITIKEFTEVKKLESKKIHLNDDILEFDWVFDARGLGAKEHFKSLRGVRGEVFTLESKDINISRPTRLLHPRYSIYIVPRKNKKDNENTKKYIIGASQIESEDDSPVSVRSTLELMSAAFSLHANFGEARITNTRTNNRPAFIDNLPKIENENGLTRINGLFRHGYLLAPAIVQKALNEGIYNDKN